MVQVMSKNCACRFLYDRTTSADDINKLENALETHTEFKTELRFRRKNGEQRSKRPCTLSKDISIFITDLSTAMESVCFD